MTTRTRSLSLPVLLLAATFLVAPLATHAALYAPGATLDPACAPTDANCGIATSSSSTTIITEPYEFQPSDENQESNVTVLNPDPTLSDIDNGLGLLVPKSYTDTNNPSAGTYFGFSAQQVAETYPNLASSTSGGTYTLNYIGLIAPLVTAVQSLTAAVENLASVITTETLNANTVNTQQLCIVDSVAHPTVKTCIGAAELQQIASSTSNAD